MELSAHEQQTKHRKPQDFKPGVSGNPAGRGAPKGLNELAAKLAADFPGIEQSAVDCALLRSAALLLLRASRSAAGDRSVRSASEARRTLEALRKRYAKAPKPTESALAAHLRKLAEQREPDEALEEQISEMAASADSETVPDPEVEE